MRLGFSLGLVRTKDCPNLEVCYYWANELWAGDSVPCGWHTHRGGDTRDIRVHGHIRLMMSLASPPHCIHVFAGWGISFSQLTGTAVTADKLNPIGNMNKVFHACIRIIFLSHAAEFQLVISLKDTAVSLSIACNDWWHETQLQYKRIYDVKYLKICTP